MADIDKPQVLEVANIRLDIVPHNGKVILDFHRSVSVMEIPPDAAEAIAKSLMKQAAIARHGVVPQFFGRHA